MLIEIIVRDRVANYYNGQVVSLEEGPLLRALLLGGKAEVLNPPNWSLDDPQETFLYKLEGGGNGTNYSKQSSSGEASPNRKGS